MRRDPLRFNLLIPNVIKICGEFENKIVADLGCGNGDFIKKIESLKVKKLYAIDKERQCTDSILANFKDVKVTLLDISKSLKIPDCIDLAICVMVIHLIKDYKKTILNISEVLANNGVIVIAIPHPCFHYDQKQINKYSATDEQFYNNEIDSYHQEHPLKNYFGNPKVTVHFYHRRLTDYINSMIENNLEIIEIDEPKISEPYPWSTIPPFLIIKAVKKQ